MCLTIKGTVFYLIFSSKEKTLNLDPVSKNTGL